MGGKWFLGVVLGVGLVGSAGAATTDMDLHASYCIEMIKTQLAILSPIVQGLQSAPASSPERAAGESAERDYAQMQQSLVRIKGYYLPRLLSDNAQDPLALEDASHAADMDMQRMRAAATACGAQVGNACDGKSAGECATLIQACGVQKDPGLTSIQAKIKACDNPDWLPY